MTKPINDKISWEIALIKKDFNTAIKLLIEKEKILNKESNGTYRSIHRSLN